MKWVRPGWMLIVPDEERDFGLCSVGVHDSERVLAMMHQVADRMDDLPHWTQMPGAESTARTCAAGTANAYISPDGIVFPCLNWRDPFGDLRQTDFKSLWAESPVVKKREVLGPVILTIAQVPFPFSMPLLPRDLTC